MDRLKRFFINGILMTAVALAVRYVAVSFNVYIANRIGAVAMGLFTLISSVYGFALTLATSGISLATTKLVSEALGLGTTRKGYATEATVRGIMKKSLLFAFCVSFVTAIGLFSLSGVIGERLLGARETVFPLKILALSLPPIALSSSLSGYFTAIRRVHKNATVQVISQALRIYLCVVLLGYVIIDDMQSACVVLVLGTTLAEIVAFSVHGLLYLWERRGKKDGAARPDNALVRRLLPITVPTALSAYMRSALVTVEHLLIPYGLEKSGASRDISLAAYGTVHSVVFPLVLFPSAISSAFAGLLVPEVSESDAARDKARIERIVCRVLKTVLLYSVGVAGVMICLAGELGSVLLEASDTAKYIAIIAPLIPIMYLDTSVDSILKGLGHQLYSMIVNIADASLSVVLVWILLPRLGIMGYMITVYFTEIVNAALSIVKLLSVTHVKVRLLDWIVKPLVCIISATLITDRMLTAFSSGPLSRTEVFGHIALICIIYAALLFLCKALSFKKIKRSVVNFFR